MSEFFATSTKSAATRNGAADLQALAQVEKWMAMIREINRERQSEPKYRS